MYGVCLLLQYIITVSGSSTGVSRGIIDHNHDHDHPNNINTLSGSSTGVTGNILGHDDHNHGHNDLEKYIHLHVTGWQLWYAWGSIFLVGGGTLVTLSLIINFGYRKIKPFHSNYWPLMAVQSSTGFAVLFVPLREIYGESLCGIQYYMSRLATILHMGPLVILSIWLWFVLSSELQKAAVSQGDPRIVKAFLRKKRMFSTCAIIFELIFLCVPPLLVSVVDALMHEHALDEVHDHFDHLCISSEESGFARYTTYFFYTLCLTLAIFLTLWTYCHYKQGRRVAYHIWKNSFLIIGSLIIKVLLANKFEEWDSSYLFVYLPFPFWSIWFVFYPMLKVKKGEKGYESVLSSEMSSTQESVTYASGISATSFGAIDRSHKNPARVSKRMFVRLLNSEAGGKAFLAHMEDMFCSEIYLFFQGARNYQINPTIESRDLIIRTYIGDTAPLEVNLPSDIVSEIDEYAQRLEPDPKMFCAAQNECRKLMKSNMDNKFRFPAEAWDEALKMRRDERKSFRASSMGKFQLIRLLPKLQGPSGVENKEYCYKNQTYDSCFTALDCCNWLINNNYAADQRHAIRKVQNLLDLNIMIPLNPEEHGNKSPTSVTRFIHKEPGLRSDNLEFCFYRWDENVSRAAAEVGHGTPIIQEENPSDSSRESVDDTSKTGDEIELTESPKNSVNQ